MEPEHFKQLHGTEILMELPWMSKPCHCIILSNPKLGTSVKPLFIDEEEEKRVISEYAIKFHDNDYKKAKAEFDQPDFCFLFAGPGADFNKLSECLKDNSSLKKHSNGSDPRCPFY
jgi:hypothetical protein